MKVSWKEIEKFLKTKYNLKNIDVCVTNAYWGTRKKLTTPEYIEGEEDIRGKKVMSKLSKKLEKQGWIILKETDTQVYCLDRLLKEHIIRKEE